MPIITLGTFLGLKTTMAGWGLVSYLAAIPIFGWLALWLRGLSLVEGLIAGVISSAVMLLSDWIHQWGHSLAARRTGYPMIGVYYYSVFSGSQYPPDEPPLPPRVHIQRALGGFWINLLIGAAIAPLALYLWPSGGIGAWVAAFAAGFNFFVVGLGALLPIDIPGVLTIDGGTILHYWRKMASEK